MKKQAIRMLVSRLIGQGSIRPNGGQGLNAVSIFLHLFLMTMASRYTHPSGLTGFRNRREIADVLGLHNTVVTKAIESLERAGLVGWFHDVGYTVNQEIFGDWDQAEKSVVAEKSIKVFDRLAELFFDRKLRQANVKRMHCLEKLLILSLAISADEQGLVSDFDMQRNCGWLGIQPDQLIKRLESLCNNHGLVLTYAVGLPLEEGLTYKFNRIILNIMHPWLQGGSGAYCYCQMHRELWVAVRGEVPKSLAELQERENKLEHGEAWLKMLDSKDQILERFEESVRGSLYGHWLDRAQKTFVTQGREKTLKEISDHIEKNPDASCKMAWEMDNTDEWQLLAQWKSIGIESRRSYERFYFHGFNVCHALVMEFLYGRVIGDELALNESHQQWEDFLNTHPLLMMQREFPEDSLAYHYLDFIRAGGHWMFKLVTGEAMKAIKLYRAECGDTNEDARLVFVTYLLDSRLAKPNQVKSLRGRLTGVMLFRRLDNTRTISFGMDIPDVNSMVSASEKRKICHVKGKRIFLVSKSYPCNADAFKAFTGQLRNFWVYGVENMPNKYNKIETTKSESWLEYIKKA